MRTEEGSRARPARNGRVLHVMRMKGVAGSERHLLELARALGEHGWRVDAVLATPQPAALRGYAAQLTSAGGGRVTVVRTPQDISISLIRHIRTRLRRECHSVLHTHLVHADWHGALAAAGVPEVAVVSTKHNHDPFRAAWLFKTAERLAARRSDATIAISASLADFVREHGAGQATVIRYGLAAPHEAPVRQPRRLRRILAIGRLEAQKGHDILLRAFASVVRTHPDVTLTISGDGSRRRRLTALAAGLGLDERVEFLGWRDDIDRLLSEADLLVHPARWEGFGLVLLEAMRAGLPIVATRVGAIPEVVADEVTGLIVEPDNPAALAAAVRRVADDDKLRARLGSAGFKRLRTEFSPVQMAAETAQLYRSVCSPRAGGGRQLSGALNECG